LPAYAFGSVIFQLSPKCQKQANMQFMLFAQDYSYRRLRLLQASSDSLTHSLSPSLSNAFYPSLSLAFGALSMSKKLRMQFPNKFFCWFCF